MLDDVTIGIKTLLRRQCLTRLLTSIARDYPGIRVVLVDDSPTAWTAAREYDLDINYIKLPFDTGLGEGRNRMIDAVQTKYCLYVDDDHVFVPQTSIEKLWHVLESGEADIAGGGFKEGKRFRQYQGLLELDKSTRIMWYRRGNRGQVAVAFTTDEPDYKIRCYRMDIINNFFLGRTELLQKIRWDPKLKINTHSDFFFRAKDQARIVYAPEVWIAHKQVREPAYNKLRYRKHTEYIKRKHGIKSYRKVGKWG